MTLPINLQSELHKWRLRNFPNADAIQQLLGVMEEVGELTHAVLKQMQEIRGNSKDHDEAILDAVGDIQIFLAGFCSFRGINMYKAYTDTANTVMKRDWLTDPEKGEGSGGYLPPILRAIKVTPFHEMVEIGDGMTTLYLTPEKAKNLARDLLVAAGRLSFRA